METKRWKYRISTGKMPVILSLGMVILFGSLSIWMHRSQNHAYIFCDVFTAIMVALLITTAYRLCFYKVLIGQDGFYYQSKINNGRFYNYGELRKAWISSGRDLNGYETQYCNFETADGQVTRFIFYYEDAKGVEYLVKKTETATAGHTTEEEECRHEYRIDGRIHRTARLIGIFVVIPVLLLFTLPTFSFGGILILPGIVGIGVAIYILITSLFGIFCFQVKIEEKGFYYQTNPFNGAYYKYRDIIRCWEVLRIYRYWRSPDRGYYYYFYFTDKNGKTKRFQFSKDVFEKEVDVLKERIERNNCGKKTI